ncbi:MAG: hypothetical protein KKG75_04250 [Nanoarchaeota archaeon]|nr:hypothetical protein [Nanoarchaeota archaeon]
MKSKIFAIFTILLLFNIAVLAEEEVEDVTDSSGLQPDSPLYFLDKAVDGLKLAFTFNEEKRARLELKVANERLKEVNVMIQRNRVESALKAQEAYQKRLEQARNRIQKLKNTVGAEVIAELETEIETQELLVEDLDAASLLPTFEEKDKAQVKNLIQNMKQVSQETKERLQERKEELIQARENFQEQFQALKSASIKPEIQNRIDMLEKKIEVSNQILGKRTDNTAEENSNLKLAKTKVEEAKAALEAGNYEEAKALTLEANKLAVLVRSVAEEAKERIRNTKEIALTREKIQVRTEALEREKKQVKSAIETLKEKEETLRERQQQITVKKEKLEEENQEKTVTNAENNKNVETATQQGRN